MKSATTASTAMPHPAIAMPVWPVGQKTEASPRPAGLPVELDGDRLLADRAVRADGEDDLRVDLEVRAGRDVDVLGRPAEVAELHAAGARELRQLRVVGEELVQPALDVEACLDALAEQRPPRGRKAAALRGDADDRGRRLEGEGLGDRGDDRRAVHRLPRPRRVDDRDCRVRRVVKDAPRRLPVVRVGREALREDRVALLCHSRVGV